MKFVGENKKSGLLKEISRIVFFEALKGALEKKPDLRQPAAAAAAAAAAPAAAAAAAALLLLYPE